MKEHKMRYCYNTTISYFSAENMMQNRIALIHLNDLGRFYDTKRAQCKLREIIYLLFIFVRVEFEC